MLLGSVAFVALGPHDPSSMLFGGMFALSTVGMLFVGGGGRSAGQRQAALDEQRRDYLRYLAVARRRVRAVAAEQRAAPEHVHPDPAAWPAVVAPGRLWERRGGDPDFGQLRVGRVRSGSRPGSWRRRPAPRRRRPVTALALRRSCALTPSSPTCRSRCRCAAAPPSGSSPRPAPGRPRRGRWPARWWRSTCCGTARTTRCSPSWRPAYLAPEWEWVKWLPHVAHPRRRDAIGPVRMVTADADDVRRWWAAELAGRHRGRRR